MRHASSRQACTEKSLQRKPARGSKSVLDRAARAHPQSVGAGVDSRKLRALDLIFHSLIHDRYMAKSYFDLGISIEDAI
jgi:hypothetical protein